MLKVVLVMSENGIVPPTTGAWFPLTLQDFGLPPPEGVQLINPFV